MRKIETKSVVEGALLLGILVILSLLTYYTPLSIVTFILLPTPIIFAVLRHNFKVALMMIFLSLILLIIVGINPYSSVMMVIFAGLTGLAMGYCFQNKIRPSIAVIVTSLATLFSIVFIFIIAMNFLGMETTIEEMIDLQLQMLETAFERISPSDANENFPFTRDDIIYILPSTVILVSLIYGSLIYLVTQKVLKRFKVETDKLPEFSQWKFGIWLVWAFVGASLIPVLIPGLNQIAFNVTQVVIMLLAVQGLAVVYFWIKKIESKSVRTITIILLVMGFLVIAQILFFIGLVDMFWNFRRI